MLLFIAGITGENRGSPLIKYKEAHFTINSFKHKHKNESKKKKQNKEKRKKENKSTRQSKNSFDNYLIILPLLT